MKQIKNFLICSIFTLPCLNLCAQNKFKDKKWEFSLGASYRSFDDIELEAFDFTSGQDNYINGAVTDMGAGNFTYNVADSVHQVDNITLDTIEYQTANLNQIETNTHDSTGIYLQMKKNLKSTKNFSIDYEISLITFFSRDSISTKAQTSNFQFNITPNEWPNANAPLLGGGPDPNISSQNYNSYVKAQIQNPMSDITATVNYEYDLNLYTLSTGIAIERNMKYADIYIGLGPSLTIVNSSVDRQATASWNNTGDRFFLRDDDTDSQNSIKAGAYSQIGIKFAISENTAVEFQSRYDWIPSEVSTDYADFQLSGFSSSLLFSFSF